MSKPLDSEKQKISDAKKIAKNTGIVGVAEIPFRVIQLITGIIVTRTVGASIYGIYTTGATILGFLLPIGMMGLRQGVIRYIGLTKSDQKETAGIVISSIVVSLCTSLILSVLLFVSSDYLADKIFHMPELRWVLKGLAVALPANILIQVANQCIRGFQNIKVYTAVQKLLQPLGSLVFVVVFFCFGFRLNALVFRDIAAGWFLVFVTVILLARTFPPALKWREAKYNETRNLIKFSLPLFLAEFLYILLLRVDIIMIAIFLSPEDVGIYGVVLRLVGFIIVPLTAIDTIIFPMVAEYMGKQDIEGMRRIYKLSVHWSLMMIAPILIVGTIYSEFLLGLFGKEFSAGYVCFGIIACGYLVRGAVGSISGVLVMGGKSMIIFYNSLGALILNIVFNYTFIHLWGIAGAALATGLITGLWGLLMLVEAKVIFDVRLPVSEVLRFFGIGAVVFAAVYIFCRSEIVLFPAANFAIGSLLGAGLFLAGLKVAGLVTDEDKIVLKSIFSRINHPAASGRGM